MSGRRETNLVGGGGGGGGISGGKSVGSGGSHGSGNLNNNRFYRNRDRNFHANASSSSSSTMIASSKSYYSNGIDSNENGIDNRRKNRNITNERYLRQQFDDDDDDYIEDNVSYGSQKYRNRNFSPGKFGIDNRHHQQHQSKQQQIHKIQIQHEVDVQNFHQIIRPFMNVIDKKTWPQTFRELAKFFHQTQSLRQNHELLEYIYTETLRSLEKIFKEKLYKTSVEEMIVSIINLYELIHQQQQLNQHNQFNLFDWSFRIYFQQQTTEENKFILLRLILSLLKYYYQNQTNNKEDNSSNHSSHVNIVQIQLKLIKALEQTNNIEIFLQILRSIILINENQSYLIEKNLENIIDIILGWYMDGNQSMMIVYMIENILLKFNYSNHIKFFELLLQTFFEDMQKYFNELSSSSMMMINGPSNNDDRSSFNQKLHLITLRIRLLAIFYRKIYVEHRNNEKMKQFKYYNQHQHNHHQNQSQIRFCLNVLNFEMKIIIDLWSSKSKCTMFEELLIECNQSFIILFEALMQQQSSMNMNITEILLLINDNLYDEYCRLLFEITDDNCSKKIIITNIDFICLYIRHLSANITYNQPKLMAIIEQIFSKKFQSIKFLLDKTIQESFISLFYQLLKLKNVDILDQSYRHILMQLKYSFNQLQCYQQQQQQQQSSTKNQNENFAIQEVFLKNIRYNNMEQHEIDYQQLIANDPSKCLLSLYLDLIILTEIVNTKHSLIGLLILSPNFIEFILYYVNLSNDWLSNQYSSIHFILIYLFCQYCNKNHYFLSQSSLFINQPQQQLVSNNDNGNNHHDNFDFNLPLFCDKESKNNSNKPTTTTSKSTTLRFTSNNSLHASNYFVDILRKLKSILLINRLKIDTIVVCLKLINNIVNDLNGCHQQQQQTTITNKSLLNITRKQTLIVVTSPEFIELIEIISEYSFTNNLEIYQLSCTIMETLLSLIDNQSIQQQYSSIINNYYCSCRLNLSNTDGRINDICLRLLSRLPFCFNAITNNSNNNINNDYNFQQQQQQTQRLMFMNNNNTGNCNQIFIYPEEIHLNNILIMSKQPSENFSSLSFQKLFDYIQNEAIAVNGNNFDDQNELNSLDTILLSSINDEQLKLSQQIRSTINYLSYISINTNSNQQNNLISMANNNVNNGNMKIFNTNQWCRIFWICFEFVQYCIENRLKTPLGKPQDTFTKIESLIKMFVSNISSSNSSLQSNKSINNNKSAIIRINMLLMIMYNFDKLISNSINNNNSIRLYQSSKLSRQFFRKNRLTCSEWLNRNRRSLMVLSLKIGQYTTVMYHGEILLRNYQSDPKLFTIDEIEFIVLLMIDSLLQMKQSEIIRGHYLWLKQSLNLKFAWIKAAIDESMGRYEKALVQYRNLLQEKLMANSNNDNRCNGQTNIAQQSSSLSSQTSTTTTVINLNSINSNKNFQCNHYTINFFHKRILNCLLNIDNYEEAIEWWSKSNDSINQISSSTTTNTQNQMANNLFGSSNIDYSYLKELSKFSLSSLDDKTMTTGNNVAQTAQRSSYFDIESNYHQLQSKLFRIAQKFYFNDTTSSSSNVDECIDHINQLINGELNPLLLTFNRCGMDVNNQYLFLQKLSHRLRSVIVDQKKLSSNNNSNNLLLFEWENDSNLDQSLNGLLWYRTFTRLNVPSNQIGQDQMKQSLNKLLLNTAHKARKTQNMNLAKKLLLQYSSNIGNNLDDGNNNNDNDDHGEDDDHRLVQIVEKLLQKPSNECNSMKLNENLLNFCYEISEYFNDKQKQELSMSLLFKCVQQLVIDNYQQQSPLSIDNQKLISKLYLKLVSTIQQHQQQQSMVDYQSNTQQSSSMENLIKKFETISMQNEKFKLIDEKFPCIKSMNPIDNFLGKLLLINVNQCRSLSKSWYQLGDWCYRWGRRLSDQDANNNVDNDGKCQMVESLINNENVVNEQPQQQRNDQIIIDFYKLAANSYIRFLHLNGNHNLSNDGDHNLNKNNNCCDNIDVTLRLLRLILKHAPELREILEFGLKETPTKPWKNITLQLFSRLNHHETYVRQSICELLCRIGSDSPHLIIFPAITGLLDDQEKSKNFDYTSAENNDANNDDDDEDKDDDDNDDDSEQTMVKNCYQLLLDTISEKHEKNCDLIKQTKLFVHELRRITVLWDELWLGILQHNMNEIKKQINGLEMEIERIRSNKNLYEKEKQLFLQEQHNIYFRRLQYSLQLTNMLTSDSPETPHEEWFQKSFNHLIEELIDSIKKPENYSEPSNILYQYQNLYQTIRKRSLIMANNNYRINMNDISPRLSQLSNTLIPMPGLNGSNVTLKGVCKTVSILHTYTKPKKIILIGSNGRNYSYLFKGHEDLHLDERIMQFLSVINQMIIKFGSSLINSNNNNNDRFYIRARHYSVTPLGNKSGLIQWVEGGHALYNLYKRWLINRDNSLNTDKPANAADKDVKDNNNNQPISIVNKRITVNEIYKLKLQENNLKIDNRNEWSDEILMKIFNELQRETPDNLISNELWYSSINSGDYWNLTQNFIISNAIMCVIGYILGLGDRHLDNILLDLTTGEIIHIDYNICFEKGKTLRVPEMVLCRLTQNIINAFGVTGTNGQFRFVCENVMKILRKCKETLLTLLEAFVYDPLIDWTPEHEEGFTGAIYGGAKILKLANEGRIIPKKQMEKENQEAIERLKQLMKQIEQRNSDWPKIDQTSTISADNQQSQPIAENLQQSNDILVKQPPPSAPPQPQQQHSIDAQSRKNKRNVYAFSVWKRIRMKLDGRDPDPQKRSSINEQVQFLINESTSLKNLSKMYEGWTGWV